jgi:hypothetical protein
MNNVDQFNNSVMKSLTLYEVKLNNMLDETEYPISQLEFNE